jgi:hypothetical protein
MRVLRMLCVSGAAAVAALALSAAGASAQSVEVYGEEPTENHHCGTVSIVGHAPSGGCAVTAHTTTNAVLIAHGAMWEMVASSCSNEFDVSIGESGSGYMFNQVLTPTGAPCSIRPCDEASGERSAWPLVAFEPGASSDEYEVFNVTFCVLPLSAAPGSPGIVCNANLELEESDDHAYELTANASPCFNTGGSIELTGSWSVEEPIEIVHHDDAGT